MGVPAGWLSHSVLPFPRTLYIHYQYSYYFHSSPCNQFFVNVRKAKLAEFVLEFYPVHRLPLFIRCKALSKERECEGCLSQ